MYNFVKIKITILITLISASILGQTKARYDRVGDSLLKNGQYDKIIKYFEKELKKYPKNEHVLRWLGYIHIIKNNLDQGENYYLQALAVNPKCARCYLHIGNVYSLRGNNKKALEYFDKAISIDPTDALLYASRANLKEILGDKFGALLDHNKAIEIAPNNYEYYIQRGLYNYNSGYSALAISDMTKAIELAPGNYYPYFKRANIYYNQRKFDEALKDINKAIELDSNQYSLYRGRGAIFHEMQEYKKAISDYSKAISLNKNDFLSYLNRAYSYYKLEDLDATCLDCETLKLQIEKGKITDSTIIKEVANIIQDICNPSKPSYYYQRGIGYYNLKEYHKALDMYTKGLSIFPDNGMMISFKGNAYLALNEYEKAIECYNLSLKYRDAILTEIKINPRFANTPGEQVTSMYNNFLASIYYNLAECKIYLGKFDEALADIDIALELATDIEGFNKETYYNLRGYIYLMNGKFEQAISDFNKSIQINTNFPIAYINRAIAKVCLTEKVKVSSYIIRTSINNQPISISWRLPEKLSLKKSEASILSALTDCNTAIEIDKNFGFAYYIRGQIKQLLMYDDYCLDLLTAQTLGLTIEEDLLKNCSK